MPFNSYKILIITLSCVFLGGAIMLYALTIPTGLPSYEASLSELYLGDSSEANIISNNKSIVMPQGFTAGKTQGTLEEINENYGSLSSIFAGLRNKI
jgi:hypothetical protein